MALTQIKDKCLLCNQVLEEEADGIYLTLAQFTKQGRTEGSHGMSYGEGWVNVKEGHLRVRMKNGKPKGGIHKSCWDKVKNLSNTMECEGIEFWLTGYRPGSDIPEALKHVPIGLLLPGGLTP